MILRSIILQNFGPYLGRRAINLQPSNNETIKPIYLVGALNGSGKTSLLDGLLLALYGQRARCSTRGSESYAKFLDQCINSYTPSGEDTLVRLEFEIHAASETIVFEVQRKWRRSDTTVREKTTVFRNGELDSALTETWAEHVEGMLPAGISNLFFFDGEQVRELATSDSPPESVRTAIRTLLGLDIPTKLQDDLKIVVNRRQKQMIEPGQLEKVRVVESEIQRMKAQSTSLFHDAGELKNKVERARVQLEEKKQRFVSVGGALAQQREELAAERGSVRGQLRGLNDTLRELSFGPLALTLIPNLVEQTLARAKVEQENKAGQENISLLEGRDSAILKWLDEHAATELQRELGAYLAADRAGRIQPLKPAAYLNMPFAELVGFRHTVESDLAEEIQKREEYLLKLQRLESQMATVEGQIEKAAPPEQLHLYVKELEDARSRLTKLEAQLEARLSDRDALAQRILTVTAERDGLLNALASLREEHLDHHRVVRAAERVNGVLKKYKERLLAKKLSNLERLICERMCHLARKGNFIDRIEVHPETFALTLYDSSGQKMQKRRLSAGEQQLLAVSFLWALALLSGRNLPVVIDTPLSRMDSKHRDKLVELYFPCASHQVVLLSTDVEIDEHYFQSLEKMGAIDRCFHIQYDTQTRSSQIHDGYFW